jgi:hypothetical protein
MVITLPFGFPEISAGCFSVTGDVTNLRILKNRHIKIRRLFGLVIEPQVWGNFLQVLGHDNSSLCFWLYGYI